MDICDSHIIKFDGTMTNELARRKVSLRYDSIVEYRKIRSTFNHMTVRYKKRSSQSWEL